MNKIVFVGAVELSRIALEALIENGIEPDLLVTLPKDLARRHSDFVDLTQVKSSIPVLFVNNINQHVEHIQQYTPDYILVWGWSQLIKKPLIELPTYGCIGLHPSPLPKNRGRAVIPWTILTAPAYTGVTMFYIDEGMDSGDIIMQKLFTIQPRETATTLYKRTEQAIAEMVPEIADTLKEGKLIGRPQNHNKASYFAKRIPEDGRIDWTQGAYDIDRLVRATTYPYPGAFTFYCGQKIVIWESEPVRTNWTGIPGQILTKTSDKCVIVQTGLEQLKIKSIGVGDMVLNIPADFFIRVHGKFE